MHMCIDERAHYDRMSRICTIAKRQSLKLKIIECKGCIAQHLIMSSETFLFC